ncbi:MAG: hypothetical protein B9J98_03970 [Candidatus Terraquivivens tikiterensis]|uniref:Uncharacterized protein n=1 Tax=Candidatus Terraquivivens tikiterensis TaxID=1980982 RepID=A0A2R7Y4Z9_9ARCH|nr:MAG: hypothetical protein B9J98_03970 [Candidatus Terraquivivens tikiterensis]
MCNKKRKNYKTQYVWLANSREALTVLKKYCLFRVKKRQAELAIEFQKNIKREKKSLSEEELQRREKIREQIIELNKNG